ncbi:hypothetical protein [Mycetocola sp. JXN-3]|uniref:hypothetical protein n=1 Tax=Mycetocola sp. JXN-3 TaxID=2116510 RepID=UPI00165D1438|nr:hypothetical protein [Mycetocola sp. JXN-3]
MIKVKWEICAGAFAVVISLSGCSNSQQESHSEAPRPMPSGSVAETSGEDSRDDLTGEGSLEWTRVEGVPADRIRIRFVLGNPECVGVRSILRESSERVLIAVVEGAVPEAPEACPLVAVETFLDVQLAEPLGARPVTSFVPDSGSLR